MIVQEIIRIGDMELMKTYSSSGVYIHGGDPEADYIEAIDPVDSGRVYVETDIPTPDGEATIEDYEAALEKLGVDLDE